MPKRAIAPGLTIRRRAVTIDAQTSSFDLPAPNGALRPILSAPESAIIAPAARPDGFCRRPERTTNAREGRAVPNLPFPFAQSKED